MPITYPPLSPVLSGDTLTISRFLSSPTLVSRRLRTIAEQRFLADTILTSKPEALGGALQYGISESIYTDRAPESVAPGGEYGRALAPTGAAVIAKILKYGQDVPITDEAIGRMNMNAVESGLAKLVNQMVSFVDSLALAVIAAAVTQTQAAAAAWSAGGADPLLDLMLAQAQVADLKQGYGPDTVIVTSTLYARLVSNQKIIAGLRREGAQGTVVTETGDVQMIAGLALREVPASNMPSGVTAMILDSKVLGGLAYERIPSPEYTGDPKDGIESWVRRDPAGNDQWLVRGRRPVVPFVQEPACAVKITGA